MKDYKINAINAIRLLIKNRCLKNEYFETIPEKDFLENIIKNIIKESTFDIDEVLPEGIDRFLDNIFGTLYGGFSKHFKKTMCKNF